MDHMFGGLSQVQSMHSNAITVNVKPLPPHDDAITAVGNFTGFTSKVSMEKASEGEGIVFTLELIGNGNFAMIGHPPLHIPEGLQSYDSNAHFKMLAASTFKKDFEYVVQGVKPGTYTIDAQEFTYFDIKQKVYKTLKSKPLKITITPGAVEKSSVEREEQKEVQKISQPDELKDALYVTKWRFRTPRSLPWGWFFVVVLLPIIVSFGMLLKRWWQRYKERYAPHYGYKNAFKKSKKEIEQCRKQGSVSQLYTICIDLFAARLKLPTSEISEARIEKSLMQGGMTQEQVAAWRLFFADITAASFASTDNADKEQLCIVLLEWVIKFERVL